LQGECFEILEGLSMLASDMAPEFVVSRTCVPDDVTLFQITTVVVRWLDQHPERRQKDFRALALLALHGAWPCT
jgi:hypothetical protein